MNLIIGAILGALIVVSGVVGFCIGVQMTAKKAKGKIEELTQALRDWNSD